MIFHVFLIINECFKWDFLGGSFFGTPHFLLLKWVFVGGSGNINGTPLDFMKSRGSGNIKMQQNWK